ncbi:acyl-CoA thioesterase [Aurantibacter crassamenti]|uniref:acyl-CoA thioesterase n=1 Tax=Aurantibacter crassamenti TaxID=1837375 RepID=UPI0019397E66|nr:thioesterase family protein [Aurantibacter crassamenti]MBM1107518.1 acyl-CoA thioesterase [Aurantibacter crassamenti]
MTNFKEISFHVRYAETDQMKYVYYGNYAQYLEMGRVAWLRDLGVSYRTMEENGVMLPVVSMQIDFKKPALYDDLLTVQTTLKKVPFVKIEFDYKIFNEQKELLVTANTVLAFVDMKTNRPTACPDYVLEKIKELVQF